MATDMAILRDSAEHIAKILENLAGYEPQDIDTDSFEIRFEESGCDISIVDTAKKSSVIIRALICQLEAAESRMAKLLTENAALYNASKNLVTPATDAAITEIKAQGVDEFGIYHNFNQKQNIAAEAKKFSAKLRAGCKSS